MASIQYFNGRWKKPHSRKKKKKSMVLQCNRFLPEYMKESSLMGIKSHIEFCASDIRSITFIYPTI